MPRTIHKFDLTDVTTAIPVGGRALVRHVGMQNGQPKVWIEHDLNTHGGTLTLALIGTGHQVPEYIDFVGTFFDESFVWHVYRVG